MSEAGLRLTERQRLDWLRLMRSDGIGPRTFVSLLNRFGSARAALDALPGLARASRRPLRLAADAEVEAELAGLDRLGARLIALGEPDYPAALRAIDAAPPLIAVRGEAASLARPMVAIVGARNASALGQRFAATLARGLGEAGLVVASGLARGIDGAAHEAALAHGTVAVLAGGLARLYPPEHARLAQRLTETGCLVSEMPVEWTATGRDFPRRNRIVSGLALGTVVVEAALRSGSLITARFAAEQGREVFAVPGSPLDPRAEGTNRLIRTGATLVTGAADVVEALAPLLASGEPPARAMREDMPAGSDEALWDEWDSLPDGDGLTPGADIVRQAAAEPPRPALPVAQHPTPVLDDPTADAPEDAGRRVLSLLSPSPVSIDEVVRRSGLALHEVQLALLQLDLQGRLHRHGGNRVSLA